MKKQIWFKAKTYGWGWSPSTWQGWVITAVFILYEIALSVLIGKSFDSRPGVTSFTFLTFLGVAVLLTICFEFGETPRWSWGSSKKKS